uniref:Uncharacterized protein MANES_02G202700 n=1 Tax=Rhizophora mucronata TaxID=61149 RepID=A0A2P2KEY2_RHIMU
MFNIPQEPAKKSLHFFVFIFELIDKTRSHWSSYPLFRRLILSAIVICNLDGMLKKYVIHLTTYRMGNT